MKNEALLITIVLLVVSASGCVQESVRPEGETGRMGPITQEGSPKFGGDSRFGSLAWMDMEMREQAKAGILWVRPHPGDAIWNEIERTRGNYDWSKLDKTVRSAQAFGLNLLITIWPYASWDQEACHANMEETPDPFGGLLPTRKGIPCDWEAYEEFLRAMVERYDGDGENDMPGLRYPVRYWEIGNEPEMKHGNDIFFQGTPEDYFLLLRRSAEAIRKADPDAKILHAGIASGFDFSREFWEKVFSFEDAGNYFDIANVHDLQGSEDGNVGFVKKLLVEKGIENKPVWVTEFSLRSGMDEEGGEIDFDRVEERVKNTFENGAEKIFLILPPPPELGMEGMERLRILVGRYNQEGSR